MFNKKLLILAACSSTTILLAGCANKQMEAEVNHVYNSNKNTIAHNLYKKPKSTKFNVNKGDYTNKQVHAITPAWQKKKISIHAYQQPLANIMNIILKGTHVSVSYNDSLNSNLVNINYEGTVAGALHQLMEKNNLYYQIENGVRPSITWSEKETKVFNIAYLPGKTSFQLSSSKSNDDSNKSSDSTSSLKGDMSVWNDIEHAVKILLSSQGKIIVSQSSGTITVIDKPLNVDKISKTIKKFNMTLSKRVSIKIKVLEVQLNKQHQYGIDWNLVYKGVAIAGLSGNTLDTITQLKTGTNSGKPNSNWGDFSGSNALINALDMQGKTAIVDEPTITALNNSPSSISVTDDKAYVKSTETTTTGSGYGTATVNFTVNPSNVVTGLKMNLIPHIQDGNVYLTIEGSLSTLQKMNSVNYGSGSDSNQVRIQLPDVTSKSFNQRIMVPNGHIAVLSGLRTKDNQHVGARNFKLPLLGSDSDQINNKELVVLIEPTIVE